MFGSAIIEICFANIKFSMLTSSFSTVNDHKSTFSMLASQSAQFEFVVPSTLRDSQDSNPCQKRCTNDSTDLYTLRYSLTQLLWPEHFDNIVAQ